MNAFEKALGAEDGSWHEYNLQVAAEALAEFSAQDWESLKAIVLSKPAYWQERCAESLGCIDSDEGVQILIVLLQSPYLSVVAIVASELDNLSVQLTAAYKPLLQKLLAYLDEKKSPRTDDVQRLISNLT